MNEASVVCPNFASVNGNLESEYYQIQDGDRIQILNYYTLKQLLQFMDIHPEGTILVNREPAQEDTKIYENFKITWSEQLTYQDLQESDNLVPDKEVSTETVATDEASAEEKKETTIVVLANQKQYTLSGKETYVFAEIFDVIHFDTSTVRGTELVMLLNDKKADPFDELHNGDNISIYWRK